METLKMNNLSVINTNLQTCTACNLYKNNPIGTTPVSGCGSNQSQLMVVGECPGISEIYGGEPFIGRSGKLLRKVMKDSGIDMTNVYITNVNKCLSRQGNKNVPANKKDQHCCRNNWLIPEMKIIRPKVIMPLGKIPLENVWIKPVDLASMIEISPLVLEYDNGDKSHVVANYHPSFILQYGKKYFDIFSRQIRLAKELLDGKV